MDKKVPPKVIDVTPEKPKDPIPKAVEKPKEADKKLTPEKPAPKPVEKPKELDKKNVSKVLAPEKPKEVPSKPVEKPKDDKKTDPLKSAVAEPVKLESPRKYGPVNKPQAEENTFLSKYLVPAPTMEMSREKEEQTNEMVKKNDEIAKKTADNLEKLKESNEYLRSKYNLKTEATCVETVNEEEAQQSSGSAKQPINNEKYPIETNVNDRIRATTLLRGQSGSSKKIRRGSKEDCVKNPASNEKRLKVARALKNAKDLSLMENKKKEETQKVGK
ncbi:unnamed protein product [Caenorhabditis angaria]|uniref:Uncharacterized protein n=1 Tax=Caenorhabditis angaria TaxID=860376 RepID=A0A9P1IYH7_9PELO|nr:unnamed protein product [Caenorhabditis angaria]